MEPARGIHHPSTGSTSRGSAPADDGARDIAVRPPVAERDSGRRPETTHAAPAVQRVSPRVGPCRSREQCDPTGDIEVRPVRGAQTGGAAKGVHAAPAVKNVTGDGCG